MFCMLLPKCCPNLLPGIKEIKEKLTRGLTVGTRIANPLCSLLPLYSCGVQEARATDRQPIMRKKRDLTAWTETGKNSKEG